MGQRDWVFRQMVRKRTPRRPLTRARKKAAYLNRLADLRENWADDIKHRVSATFGQDEHDFLSSLDSRTKLTALSEREGREWLVQSNSFIPKTGCLQLWNR